MRIDAIVAEFLPADGSPLQFIIVSDAPSPCFSAFLSKQAMERAHLDRYRDDHEKRFGEAPFDNVAQGGDPPDFSVVVHGTYQSLDCAAVTIQARRRAEALFRRLSERLTENVTNQWPNLRGCDVSISFTNAEKLPPAVHDRSLDEAIDLALASITVDHAANARHAATMARGVFPGDFPANAIGTFSHKEFHITANPIASWQPRDETSRRLGFDLNLQFQVTVQEVESEVRRLVEKHDKPQIDRLLLTVGGPDKNGYCFPADSMLGRILTRFPISEVGTKFLSTAVIHVWDTGQIKEVPLKKIA